MHTTPPPALLPPSAPPKTPEQLKLESQQRQLRLIYNRWHSSPDGQVILDDLKQRFGWFGDIERPSYRPGMSHADMSFTEGMKEPVRHILAMVQPVAEKPAQKPETATTT